MDQKLTKTEATSTTDQRMVVELGTYMVATDLETAQSIIKQFQEWTESWRKADVEVYSVETKLEEAAGEEE